jgi:hypothetical protein
VPVGVDHGVAETRPKLAGGSRGCTHPPYLLED